MADALAWRRRNGSTPGTAWERFKGSGLLPDAWKDMSAIDMLREAGIQLDDLLETDKIESYPEHPHIELEIVRYREKADGEMHRVFRGTKVIPYGEMHFKRDPGIYNV